MTKRKGREPKFDKYDYVTPLQERLKNLEKENANLLLCVSEQRNNLQKLCDEYNELNTRIEKAIICVHKIENADAFIKLPSNPVPIKSVIRIKEILEGKEPFCVKVSPKSDANLPPVCSGKEPR